MDKRPQVIAVVPAACGGGNGRADLPGVAPAAGGGNHALDLTRKYRARPTALQARQVSATIMRDNENMSKHSVSALIDAIGPEELRLAVGRIAGKQVARINNIEDEAPPPGCAGYVCPKTFMRVDWTSGNRTGQVRMVAKWSNNGCGEGRVYDLLASHNLTPL